MIVPRSVNGGTETIASSLVAEAESCIGANIYLVNETVAFDAIDMSATSAERTYDNPFASF